MMGLKGEQVVDNHVWITKTHCPSAFPRSLHFNANKTIIIYRSPLDVCYSYLGLTTTQSHSLKIKTKIHETYPQLWNSFVYYFSIGQAAHFDILNTRVATRVPMYFVRYEDLLNNST